MSVVRYLAQRSIAGETIWRQPSTAFIRPIAQLYITDSAAQSDLFENFHQMVHGLELPFRRYNMHIMLSNLCVAKS